MNTSEKTAEKILDAELKPLRIYTKNSLFESTTPASLLHGNLPPPIVNLEVSADVYPLNKDKGLHEAVLTIHITAKHQDKVLWRIQYQQAGLYRTKGLDEEQEKMMLNGFCMNQLYSYASTEITRLIAQGGFSPTYLDPLNFEQLYRNRKQVAPSETGDNSFVSPGKQSDPVFLSSQVLE